MANPENNNVKMSSIKIEDNDEDQSVQQSVDYMDAIVIGEDGNALPNDAAVVGAIETVGDVEEVSAAAAAHDDGKFGEVAAVPMQNGTPHVAAGESRAGEFCVALPMASRSLVAANAGRAASKNSSIPTAHVVARVHAAPKPPRTTASDAASDAPAAVADVPQDLTVRPRAAPIPTPVSSGLPLAPPPGFAAPPASYALAPSGFVVIPTVPPPSNNTAQSYTTIEIATPVTSTVHVSADPLHLVRAERSINVDPAVHTSVKISTAQPPGNVGTVRTSVQITTVARNGPGTGEPPNSANGPTVKILTATCEMTNGTACTTIYLTTAAGLAARRDGFITHGGLARVTSLRISSILTDAQGVTARTSVDINTATPFAAVAGIQIHVSAPVLRLSNQTGFEISTLPRAIIAAHARALYPRLTTVEISAAARAIYAARAHAGASLPIIQPSPALNAQPRLFVTQGVYARCATITRGNVVNRTATIGTFAATNNIPGTPLCVAQPHYPGACAIHNPANQPNNVARQNQPPAYAGAVAAAAAAAAATVNNVDANAGVSVFPAANARRNSASRHNRRRRRKQVFPAANNEEPVYYASHGDAPNAAHANTGPLPFNYNNRSHGLAPMSQRTASATARRARESLPQQQAPREGTNGRYQHRIANILKPNSRNTSYE